MALELRGSKAIKIGNATFQVKYPTVGQLIEIENKKMYLTNDKYASFISNPLTIAQRFSLDLVDVISTLSVLIPSLNKELAIDNILDFDPVTGKELIKVYKEQFLPWYQELQELIYDTVVKRDENEAGAAS